jgi:signal transduction histidine kinase
VHAFPERADDQRIILRISHTSVHLDIAVIDNGAGMSPEVVMRATEPFFTTRRGAGGSGLGLHIANSIAHGRFGGDLCLDSAPGRGTGVHLRLPFGTAALSVVRA